MKRIHVPVEPLSEARWDAIEHNVLARVEKETPKKPAPRFVWFAAAAAILLVVFAGALLKRFAFSAAREPLANKPTPARMTVGESTLDLEAGAIVSVSGDDAHGVLVKQDWGHVDFEIAPRNGRPPFVIETPRARVEVVGTHFQIAVDKDRTSVTVQSGIVRVSANGSEQLLAKEQSWSSDFAAPLPQSSAPSISVSDLPQHVTPPTKTLTAREQYELAASLEQSDPDRAIKLYDELAQKGGAWADNALFAEANLQAVRKNHPAARTLLTEYLRKYPSGPNALDARTLLDHMEP